MKKLLGIISFVFLFCNISFADDNPCSFSWSVDKSGFATFTVENKSTSSQVAKISTVIIYAANSQKILTEIFDPPIYVKPFNKKEFKVVNQELMWDLAKSASIGCYPITLGMLEIETKPENKKTNNWSRTNNKPKGNIWIWGGLAALFLMFVVWLSEISDKKKVKTKKLSKPKQTNINLIQYVWNGNETLSKTFWIYCILIGVIVSLISGILMGIVSNLFSIIPVIYFTWSSIGLWNSSTKYQILKLNLKQSYGWAIASKIYVVLNLFTVFGQSILLFAN